ncbi:hypothetical protein P171DRAFT_276181 [Karstenula rhodostoma CBS 690.94]|uniref:Peptidase S8/S53 domain-containing protein n=1 Tax=Karstenula rhodostoma CBS 690.94 TaxID=1392251 RepID=A0A9P4PML5_9PLEO|nr:hypothetical protein P171DRAFT_276181 [Karstenula rhodostoma CBS 690.94]
MSSTSQSTKSEGNSTASASPSSLNGGSTTPSSSDTVTSEKHPTSSTIQNSSSRNSTAIPSEHSSRSASGHIPQTQPSTEHQSTTSAGAPTETQYVVSTVTASDGSSGLVTFTKTVEAAPSSGGSGETAPVGPSRTNAPSSTHGLPIFSPFPSAYIFDAVIAGQSYHLPSPDGPPTVIILHDGKVAKLSHDKVTIGGESVPISQISEETKIDGVSVQKKAGEADKPQEENEGGGDGGGGGIGGLLGGLVGSAKKAVNGVKDAGESALGVPAAAVAGAGAATFAGIAGKLSTAGNGVNTLVSGLNGIQNAVPKDKLSQAGLGAAMDAQNLGRQASNWLGSTSGLVKDFPNLPKKVQDQVVDDIKKFAGEGGQLGKAQNALEAFRDFPWESELPQSQLTSATQKPTGSPTNRPSGTSISTNTASREASEDQTTTTQTTFSSTQTSTKTSSRTSSKSASATPDLEEYMILSRDGTELQEFDDFVQGLDKGKGQLYSWKHIKSQMYVTSLTPKQTEKLPKNHTFIDSISLCTTQDENYDGRVEEFRGVDPRAQSKLARQNLFSKGHVDGLSNISKTWKRAFVSDEDAPWWKKMISASAKEREKPLNGLSYLADDFEGEGTTIYILDDGFDLSLDELAPDGRTVGTTFASNKLTLTGIKEAQHFHEGIGGGAHGTMMAIIAAGKTLGIAPKANLFLAKTKNKYKNKYDSNMIHYGKVTPQALAYVFAEIRDHIRARLQQDPNAKSVINISWGQKLNEGGQNLDKHFETFIALCKDDNIPVVIAAGNKPFGSNLHTGTPQHWGRDDNNIITVGAVKKDGTLWPGTAVPVPNEEGSMTVYAPGEKIEVPSVGGDMLPENELSGTSQAAAMTSGLIAYLYQAPQLGKWVNHPAGFDVKRLLVNHAWTRVRRPIITPEGWPPLDSLDVVYNLARDSEECVERRDGNNGTNAHCIVSTATSQLPSATQNLTGSATNRPSGTSLPTETASRQTSEGQTTTQNSTSVSTTSAHNTTALHSTQSASITSSSNTTSATSSSSAEPTPTETTKYYIVTKDGTSLDDFKQFIDELDNAAGLARTYKPEYVPHQTYLTMLKPEVAEKLQSRYNFIRWVIPCVFTKEDLEADDEEFRAVNTDKRRSYIEDPYLKDAKLPTRMQELPGDNTSAVFPRALSSPNSNAPYWKKMLSSPYHQIPNPPSEDPGYRADESLGRGVTIYVVDDGFDIHEQERDLIPGGRRVDTFVVSKEEVTLQGFIEEQRKHWKDAKVFDQNIWRGDHGTKMAIIAAGAVNGVARRANLYLMKAKGQYQREVGSDIVNLGYTVPAIQTTLDEIKRHIEERKRSNPNAKSVLSWSWGKDRRLKMSGANFP